MKRLLSQDRDQLAWKCHLYIPMELVYEADKWQVDIDDTCIEAITGRSMPGRKPTILA